MINFTKEFAKTFMFRVDSKISKENLVLNKEIFDKLYSELENNSSTEYNVEQFEDFYYSDLYEMCEHDNYEIVEDEDDYGNEYTYAICRYCGAIGKPDGEGGFECWELQ